jgi:hypothetical protein
MCAGTHDRPRAARATPERPLRRFRPARGAALTMDAIRGPWRPTSAVACAGVFAVRWETRAATFWAPLHDFAPADQLRLIEACRWADQNANGRTA